MGTLYRRRKEFDDSVMLINETLSAYFDLEEEKAQAMFPHDFEKHKSDGVEFGIYVGASLVESGTFDRFYLHNLRLWQLLVMCGMARQAERLKGRLTVPLDVAHLILGSIRHWLSASASMRNVLILMGPITCATNSSKSALTRPEFAAPTNP